MSFEVIDHGGKLAITDGWSSLSFKPVQIRSLWVSDMRSDWHADLIGKTARSIGRTGDTLASTTGDVTTWEVALCSGDYRYVRTPSLSTATEERPIVKPRTRKNGDVPVWANGRWVFCSLQYAHESHPEQY